MEQLKQFNIDKQAAIDTLISLKKVLNRLEVMGVDVKNDTQKIAESIKSIESDVLRIALLGAFSDGKTSVIAAWLGKIMDNMKIDMDESSDRLAIYKPEGLPEQCEIIDTPGLFGDKEKIVDGTQVMYEDVTKRYISEAHLILYVVDATNPLKESHAEIAKWILRDLNKLSSTVFVINKMDEVTDLTEQVLFDEQAKIKKDNLKLKLQRAANLTSNELSELNIVCIASNPNGRGLEFWFSKPEHYESRSRINDLKTMTSQILQSNVPDVLIAKTGIDVVRDIVNKKVAEVANQLNDLKSYEQMNKEESNRIQQDIVQGRDEVKRLAGELYNELQAMESQILSRLRPLSLEDIRNFLDDEIGYSDDGVGYKLYMKIKITVDRYFSQSSAIVGRISQDIGRQINSSESFINSLSESALKSVSGALKGVSKLDPSKIKETIFAARDLLGKLGVSIKFKPWEASKLAGSISKWAGPVGGIISLGSDIYKGYKEHQLEEELKQVKSDIVDLVKGAFKDIYDILADDQKLFDFFAPQLNDFEKIVSEINKNTQLIAFNRNEIESIQKQLRGLTSIRFSRDQVIS